MGLAVAAETAWPAGSQQCRPLKERGCRLGQGVAWHKGIGHHLAFALHVVISAVKVCAALQWGSKYSAENKTATWSAEVDKEVKGRP
jgi:hypothetical protein